MRHIILIMAIAIPFLSFGQSTVNPDDTPWHDGNNRTWYQSGLGTDFCNYNGVIHVLYYPPTMGVHPIILPCLSLKIWHSHSSTEVGVDTPVR